jgi:hypothetical protein
MSEKLLAVTPHAAVNFHAEPCFRILAIKPLVTEGFRVKAKLERELLDIPLLDVLDIEGYQGVQLIGVAEIGCARREHSRVITHGPAEEQEGETPR